MKKIPLKIRKVITSDPEYQTCALVKDPDHVCQGRLTWHHPFIFGGSQVVEKFATVAACAKSHGADGYSADQEDLDKLELFALTRATDFELSTISKAIDYKRRREFLKAKIRGDFDKPIYSSPVSNLGLQMAFNF